MHGEGIGDEELEVHVVSVFEQGPGLLEMIHEGSVVHVGEVLYQEIPGPLPKLATPFFNPALEDSFWEP